MGEVGKQQALGLIKAHQAATVALHAKLRANVDASSAADLDKALAIHKGAQQGLEDDAQGIIWTP
ncbi:MAG: hypothetical protein ACLPSH_18785 [Vulcanimicrobiaceae bacterium]